MKKPYLRLDGITKRYDNKIVLNSVNLEIKKGSFSCILGPSGCGKTTLLRIISGIEQLDEGLVFLEGDDITDLSPSKRNFGIVFQSYALFPNLTVSENIAYGLESRKKFTKKDKKQIVKNMIKLVHLEQEKDRYPYQLSGGQQQRVALARALAISPKLLLLDEPLSALDAKVRIELRRELRRIHDETGITTIMVTHDQEEALTLSDHIVVMNQGNIEQIGTPDDVYSNPKNPFVASFVGTMNFLKAGEDFFGVRPEKLTILKAPLADSHPAEIIGYEFRGSYYRVTVQIISGKYADNEVIVDTPSEQFVDTLFSSGKKIYIDISEKDLIIFSPYSGFPSLKGKNRFFDDNL
ncbi:MAG: ABC transporter ATP-binding protein [Calditerrivibrio sp.]|nr:ABC transporter ATP-binding protein [Calditerrivibrio sp.]MCA1931989.1 ABC transporter ATP-binding protein [Calditerrivibrio sp.]MCA1980173.1 ABC transporter ATP-binding protein [Calditerrivibrio sp.]